MSRQRLFALFVTLLVTSHLAAPQTLTKPAFSPYVAPIATTSFTPYFASGTLGSTLIYLNLIGVSFGPEARSDGKIMFTTGNKSVAALFAQTALPSGNYSVQFTVSHTNQPTVFTITRGSSTLLTSCSLVASTTLTQTCNSGVFFVGDGKLDLSLTMTQGYQAILSMVTINRWQ